MRSPLQRHLDGDRPLFEIVEREAGEKCVGREAIGMDHAPPGVAEMGIHRGKDRIDLGFGLCRYLVGVVRIPHVRVSLIGNNVAMRCRDPGIAEPALPPIGLGDGASQLSCHGKWS